MNDFPHSHLLLESYKIDENPFATINFHFISKSNEETVILKCWLDLFWVLEPWIKGTWEEKLQIGDKTNIRFQLTTWKCILQNHSIFRTPAVHEGLLPLFLREEIEFVLAHWFVDSENCSENWREFSPSDPSSRNKELRLIYFLLTYFCSFHPRQLCLLGATKYLNHWSSCYTVQSPQF